MIQVAKELSIAPDWIVGVMFIMEVFAGIFLEKRRRNTRKSPETKVRKSSLCSEHANLVDRLIRIEKKLDRTEVLDKLDKITDILTYSGRNYKP